MTSKELTDLLEEHGVKATSNRLIVAKALRDEERPLSMMELEDKIGSVDKSGIFRSLSLFKEHHLVHQIEGGGDGVRYELCLSQDTGNDEDTHVHFFCEKCRRTFCLENIPVPSVTLPEKYKCLSANYLIKGICPECAARMDEEA